MVDEMGPRCCGKPHQAQRLTEVSLLIFMTHGICHGYAMLEKLRQLNLGLEDLNFYRIICRWTAVWGFPCCNHTHEKGREIFECAPVYWRLVNNQNSHAFIRDVLAWPKVHLDPTRGQSGWHFCYCVYC